MDVNKISDIKDLDKFSKSEMFNDLIKCNEHAISIYSGSMIMNMPLALEMTMSYAREIMEITAKYARLLTEILPEG